MGACCCCPLTEQEPVANKGELTPLIQRDQEATDSAYVEVDVDHEQNRAKYYQSVVDDARRRFISTFSGNTNVNDESNTESMRTRLDAVTFDQSTIKNSPNTLMSSARRPNNQYQETSSNNHRSMTEILNEPLNTNYYEIIADEVAEIVSKHTYNMRVDDSDTGIVVLKPGSSANASNSTSLAQSS